MPEGTSLVLDGDAGGHVDPPEELVRGYERQRAEREQVGGRAASAAEPAQTRDGRRTDVVANVGSLADVEVAVANGAEGGSPGRGVPVPGA